MTDASHVPVIEVHNISKRYQLRITKKASKNATPWVWAINLLKAQQIPDSTGLWALRDVSFSIGQGELVALIGRNGAGKTTLLRILSNVTAPTTGVVSVRGTISSLLETSAGFHPEFTGEENTYFTGVLHGMRKNNVTKKLPDIAAFAELETFMHVPLKYYSTGMKARLAFSVALHLQPDILLIDETLAVGDTFFRQRCIQAMKESIHDGRTVLFVGHQAAILKQLCTRGIVLDKGQVQFDGPIQKALQRYRSLYPAT